VTTAPSGQPAPSTGRGSTLGRFQNRVLHPQDGWVSIYRELGLRKGWDGTELGDGGRRLREARSCTC